MQREIAHGVWEKIQADEDCADDEELRELPELHHSEAAHPALQLRHICDAGSQGAGVPRLRAGKGSWQRGVTDLMQSLPSTCCCWSGPGRRAGGMYFPAVSPVNSWIPCHPQLSPLELALLSTALGAFLKGNCVLRFSVGVFFPFSAFRSGPRVLA